MKIINSICQSIFRPACLVYIFLCTAAFGVSIWSNAIFTANPEPNFVNLPIAKTLLTVQSCFMILIYPAILFLRKEKMIDAEKKWSQKLLANLIEILGFYIISLPLYYVAQFYSSTSVDQLFRGVLATLFCIPVSLSIACALDAKKIRPIVLATMIFFSGANYYAAFFLSDFLRGLDFSWLIELSPVSFTWIATGEVLPNFWLRYLGEIIGWLILSALFVCFGTLLAHKKTNSNTVSA